MFKFLLILIFLFFVADASKHEKCTKNIAFYEAIKCAPMYVKMKRNCPTKFDCSFVMETPHDKCHFQGKYYEINEVVDDKKTSLSRLRGCTCKKFKNKTQFVCKTLECLEVENNDSDCYEYFENPLDGCPSKIQCSPFDDLHKCDYNGRKTKEGSLFSPINKPCTLCVCQKKTKKVACEKITCASEALNSVAIRNYHAPLYFSSTPCCPYVWIEPRPIKKVTSSGRKTGPKCRFGGEHIDNGKTFVIIHDTMKVNCSCEIPPFVTCMAPL